MYEALKRNFDRLIRTLRERFSLGPPLTGRDAVAADLAPILSRDMSGSSIGAPGGRRPRVSDLFLFGLLTGTGPVVLSAGDVALRDGL